MTFDSEGQAFYAHKAKQQGEEYLKHSTLIYILLYTIKLFTSKIALIKEDKKLIIFLT